MAPSRSQPLRFYEQVESCQIFTLSHLYSLFLGEKNEGSFVEVGANDGVFVSNSWGLATRNWRGLMIEPVPSLAEACRSLHRNHQSIRVLETAIGPPGVDKVRLQLAGALTTGNQLLAAEYAKTDWAVGSLTNKFLSVPCTTLDILLDENEYEPDFEVLIIDVEGSELEVFQGFNLDKWAPKMLIVELVDTHPDLSTTAESDAKLGLRIQGSGYQIVYKDLANTVFVRTDVWKSAFHCATI